MQHRIVQTVTKQPGGLLEAMELISDIANNSHLNDDFFKAVDLPADYLAESLAGFPVQAVMSPLPTEQSEDSNIRLRWMATLYLALEDARKIALRFDFSGGEIGNIVRRYSVAAIPSGSDLPDIQTPIKICDQEHIQPTYRRKVGSEITKPIN